MEYLVDAESESGLVDLVVYHLVGYTHINLVRNEQRFGYYSYQRRD
jgi:hypothetical protein